MMTPNKPILLVEDDQVDVMTTRRALKELRIDNPLVVCEHGEDALDYLRRAHDLPCIVLLDINMPVMDGIEFLREVKRDARLRRIPAVVLTTSEEQGDRDRSFDLGAVGFMPKPPAYRRFVEVLHSIDRYWTLSGPP
jgi:CheY-like chemotaxis protein